MSNPHIMNRESKPRVPSSPLRQKFNTLNFTQMSLLCLAAAYTLYFIRPVLLPVILALLLSLILKPIHRFLCHIRIPSLLSSIMIILSTLGVVIIGIYYLLAPAIDYTDKLRDEVVKKRLNNIFYPITRIQNEISDVASQVDDLTNPEENTQSPKENLEGKESSETPLKPRGFPYKKKLLPPGGSSFTPDMELDKELKKERRQSPKAVRVTVADSPVDQLLTTLKSIGYHLTVTLTLVYFLLAYGEKMFNRITEVRVTAKIMAEVTNEISRYMFTIAFINLCLGTVIGTTLWMLDMPNPILWGALAMILNFIPYLGAIVGAIIIFLVAATHYDDPFYIVLVPAVYYLITAIEGNLVTPAILGDSFSVNPVIVFVWVLCWGALWGIPGMLIGLPLLMAGRIILSSTHKFRRLEHIISN